MNVYHKILVKLYKKTEGKTNEKVDLVDLVKKEGFYPSYKDIFKQLSDQGWIIEAGRADTVCITHWGIKEAKKADSGGDDSKRQLERSATRLRSEVKEFLVITEEFVSDSNEENLKLIEGKLDVIKKAISNVKEYI